MTIGELFRLILPVFALIAVGAVLRRFHWIEGAAEASLVRLVVNVLTPCLVFDTIVGNPAMRDPGNLFLPPLAGLLTTVVGLGVATLVARGIGLKVGTGLRTFAFAAGVCNYRYIPFPIVGALWGARAQGVVIIFGFGVELAIFSVGLVILTGASVRGEWRRLVSPMLMTLIGSVVINMAGLAPHVPEFASNVARSLGVCAVPVGTLMIGVSLADYLDDPARLLHWNVAFGSCAARILIVPALCMCLACLLPWSVDLKRVIIIEAAMPAGVFPIILARHYGGQPLTAVQVALATTIVCLLTCPLWIRAGLAWAGVG
jgi:malate permease and related proteins